MIVLLDTNEDLNKCEEEIGVSCEQLLTPLTKFNRQRKNDSFAIDNGAFSNFNPNAFRSLLARETKDKEQCRFVAVPDVPMSAIRTRETFDYWSLRIHGWPLAYVCQDGQDTVSIPWNEISAIFIGGSTEFKMGHCTKAIIKAAKAMEKWIHVGRVNSPGRFEYFDNLGANSIDGTGLARFTWMREAIYYRDVQAVLYE
jgi:hypothetical protein